VTPCLVVHGAARALDFDAQVFGAAERMRTPGPGGTIAHAEIQIGDSVVIVEDEDPQRGTAAPPAGGLPGTPVFQFIYGYHLFHATRAELLRDLGHTDQARAADARALTLTDNPAQRSLLRHRLSWT
jgi:hypothetical protein